MPNLNVAVLGPPEYTKDLGKKGTVSDISMYDLKKDQDTVTFIEPSKWPERLAPLFFAISMADVVLLVVDALTPQFGEAVIMIDCLGVKRGYFVLRNYLVPEQIAPLVKGTVLESFQFIGDDTLSIRQLLLDQAKAQKSDAGKERGSVPIDHFFNVKGVGPVVLGYVASGTIRKHDDLRILPTSKTAQVRSIQKHDDDFDIASKGDRVGLALKNVEVEDLDRGYVLSNDTSLRVEQTIEAEAELVKYWKSPIREGMVLHIGHWMQFLPSRVISARDSGDWRRPTLRIGLEKPLVHEPESTAVLTYLEGGKLRVIGTLHLP